MPQTLNTQGQDFTVGYRSIQPLVESYRPDDMAEFQRTMELFERGSLREAMHTDDLPIALAGNTDLNVRDAFKQVSQPWRECFGTASYTNFRQQTIHSGLSLDVDDESGASADSGRLPEVPEGHDYSDARASEHYEYAQLKTYGVTFTVTRQMLMNDDRNTLSRIPRLLGRAAANTLNYHVAQVLEANASTTVSGPTLVDGYHLFETSNRDNMNSAAQPLSAANVKTEMLNFADQTHPSGYTNGELGIMPKYLIVPQALRLTALEITSDAAIIASSETFKTEDNLLADLTPVVFPWLTSDVDWYLAADPADCMTVEVGFLNGQQSPETFVQASNFGNFSEADGQRHKIRYDFDTYAAYYAGLRKIDDTT